MNKLLALASASLLAFAQPALAQQTGGGAGGSGCSGACTYTDTQTITLGTAAHSILKSTGGSNTGSDATSAEDLAWTLNTTGSPDVVAWRITDTARGASTKFFNIYGGASGTTSLFNIDRAGNITGNASIGLAATGLFQWNNRSVMGAPSNGGFSFQNSGASGGFQLSATGASAMTIGPLDAAAPAAQTVRAQSVVAGTTNTAGADLTLQGSQGTGTGNGGAIALQVAPAGTTGSAVNAEVTALKLDANMHLSAPGTAPAVSSCGTGSPAVSGSDIAGQITIGTTATACTLTFKIAYAAAPACVLSDKTNLSRLTSYTVSTTAIILTMGSNSGDVVSYVCIGA